MDAAATLSDAARTLARLSLAIADALHAGDLDAAERLVDERGRLLEVLSASADAGLALDAETIRRITAANARSRAHLTERIGDLRAQLGDLAAGARALHGYAGASPMAPGYVDARD